MHNEECYASGDALCCHITMEFRPYLHVLSIFTWIIFASIALCCADTALYVSACYGSYAYELILCQHSTILIDDRIQHDSRADCFTVQPTFITVIATGIRM